MAEHDLREAALQAAHMHEHVEAKILAGDQAAVDELQAFLLTVVSRGNPVWLLAMFRALCTGLRQCADSGVDLVEPED